MAKNKKNNGHHHHGTPPPPPPPPEKKVVKKRSGCLPLLILLLLLLLALWFLIKHLGLFGFGDGSKEKGDGGNKQTGTSQAAATTEASEKTIEVCVAGTTYRFGNSSDDSSYDLDGIITEVKKTEDSYIVRVHPMSDAIDDAVNKLVDKLKEENIKYILQDPDVDD